MDAALRRVIEQREREQEAAIVAASAAGLVARQCRLCGDRVRQHEGQEPLTVCTACGGRKKQHQLERLDRRNEAAARRIHLLALAGIPKEPSMPAERRKCLTCQKPLHWKTNGDHCAACQGTGVPAKPRAAKVAGAADVRKQFRTLTQALNFDGEALIDAFCAGWIENLRSKVQPADDADAYRLSGDDA